MKEKTTTLEKVGVIFFNLFGFYFLVWHFIAAPYFWYRDVKENDGFIRAVFWSPLVGEVKGAAWPYFAFFGPRRSSVTSEERDFAEQWNKWLENHPNEINDIRTRAIAGNMTKEDMSRELIGLMVRFSNEADLDIPQRFIDEIKKGEAFTK